VHVSFFWLHACVCPNFIPMFVVTSSGYCQVHWE
jgi:hypothetical protein